MPIIYFWYLKLWNMRKKNRNFFIHLLIGVLFLSVPFIIKPEGDSFEHSFRDEVHYILLLGLFYLNYFLLIDVFYFKKKYVNYSITILILFFVIAYIPSYLVPFKPLEQSKNGFKEMEFDEYRKPIVDKTIRFEKPHKYPKNFELFRFSHNLFIFFAVIFLSLLLKIKEQLKSIEEERVNAELSYLKSQINPHFLFNTLNSIYSLAIDKSDYTATAIVKLSGMMRYVLSKSSEDFVTLEEEINYISSYIEMQRLRFGETFKLSYNVEGDLENNKIAPLILIPFVENAFKHGVNAEENSCILINIVVVDKELNFTVDNKKVKTNHDIRTRSGLGIEITKSRLKHLYPQKHSLVINEEEKDFMVSLKIELL